MFLSDPQWILLQPLFSASSRGRPASDKRLILEAIFWKLTSAAPWYDIPGDSPSWQTCYHYFHRWRIDGTWKSIIRALLLDLTERGRLNLQQAWDNHEISLTRHSSGPPSITYPPHLADTWQLTTAFLLICLLASNLYQ